ncbi:MAG: class I SAM-dependent methyltransferase [Sutterella wadsworthensis]|nr:class I SAM-dependent methyltransferase [Sutterella wadsworthensis]
MAKNPYAQALNQPSPWVMRWRHLLSHHGQILDLACGGGRHTALLALENFDVLAVDIDVTQVEPLGELPNVTIECRDLENEPWPWEAERFAGIIVTNYLHRPHFAHYWESLAPGGLFLMETFTRANTMIWAHPKNPAHFLEEGELLRLMPTGARLIAYEEGMTALETCVARIAFMKPAAVEPYALPLENYR